MAHRELILLTRPGCSLCDAARRRLEPVARLLRVPLQAADITTAPDLESEYHLRIPVVLDGRGRVVAEGVVTAVGAWSAVWRTRFARR